MSENPNYTFLSYYCLESGIEYMEFTTAPALIF